MSEGEKVKFALVCMITPRAINSVTIQSIIHVIKHHPHSQKHPHVVFPAGSYNAGEPVYHAGGAEQKQTAKVKRCVQGRMSLPEDNKRGILKP
jgi:hypothetical protein